MHKLASVFENFKNFIALSYGKNPGKMLIHTGVIGWALSSVAQMCAIAINDKITKEQKMFMIPQEFADAVFNILSFFVVTNVFKSVASHLTKTGKWSYPVIKDFLKKNNMAEKIGQRGFNIFKDGNLSPELFNSHSKFSHGIDVISTITGSVISCNVITPILRNIYASERQKTGIVKMHKNNENNNYYSLYKPSINDFTKGNLKI